MEKVSTTSYHVLPPSAPVLDAAEITHQPAQGKPTGRVQSLFNYSQAHLHSGNCGSNLDSYSGVRLWQWQLERVTGPPAE